MNRGFAFWLIFVLPAAMFACGDDVNDETDDDGGSGSTSGGNVAALTAACEDYCEATAGVDCGGEFQISEAQCKAGCSVVHEQLGGLCIAEYTAAMECAAQGGFECYEDTPVPLAACTSQSLALSECMQDMECKQFCAEAVEAGCSSDEDTCLSDCTAEVEAYDEESFCGYEYQDVLRCWSENDLQCPDGRPGADGCERELLDMGDCLSFDDMCAGYCWVADQLGCGEGCEADCEAETSDSQCGFEYEDLLRCRLWGDSATCENGTLVAADQDCSYEQERLDDCRAG